MYKKFQIENSIALKENDKYYDLHNDYDLFSLSFNHVIQKNLVILFRQTNGDWIKAEDPKQLKIEFKELTHFSFSDNYFSENASVNIEEIGFKSKNDYDYDWLVTDEQMKKNEKYHFILRMDDNSIIRIGCKEIVLSETPIILKLENMNR